MFRNYLMTALRNLARNRLYAGITIAGLSLGLGAAILIGLYVRSEVTFDRFIPGYRQVYQLTQSLPPVNGNPVLNIDTTRTDLAAALRSDYPQIEAVARLAAADDEPQLRHGQVEGYEPAFVWADPDIFKVLPFKAVAGDLGVALSSPDGLVLTRSVARKYFGRDAPIDEVLLVSPATLDTHGAAQAEASAPHPMRIKAVIEDLPSNTSLRADVFASGLASFSDLTRLEQQTAARRATAIGTDSYTLLRLKPGASAAAMVRDLPSFAERHIPPNPLFAETPAQLRHPARATLHLTPLAAMHMSERAEISMKDRGSPTTITAIAAVAVLIVLTASINFVTLMTARAARRAVETGVRKVAGATRWDLMVQFLGEALIYVALSMLLAMMLAELLAPALSAFLGRDLRLDYRHDPMLCAAIIGATLVLGGLAGFYPAFVLSSFRPASVLKGGPVSGAGGAGLRQGLVVLQFAILIGLIVTTTVIYRQTRFALTEALRVNTDQVVQIENACNGAFPERIALLPGVRSVGCSEGADLSTPIGGGAVVGPNGRTVYFPAYPVGAGFFEVFGLKPLAGRFFIQGRDNQPHRATVINETAMRRLGFATPAAAVGQTVKWLVSPATQNAPGQMGASEVIGVTPDFSFGSVRRPIAPFLFVIQPANTPTLSLRLTGRNVPETLQAIDRVWAELHGHNRIHRQFMDQQLQAQYADTILQGQMIGLGAALALIIACMGLFALSAYTAERRTKEIGIRKAMGASTAQILNLLVWQFTQPVLWANLIAWPVGWWLMSWWLEGFAYHIDLSPWIFAMAAAAALLIAWATVSMQAWLVARAKPIGALRYE